MKWHCLHCFANTNYFEDDAYKYWTNLSFFPNPNFEFGDGCIKITILSHGNFCVLVEKLNQFSDEYEMCGTYVTSNCRKTYDPVEFVTLIKESQYAYFMKPIVNLFDSHTYRKQEALRFLLDLKEKVVVN